MKTPSWSKGSVLWGPLCSVRDVGSQPDEHSLIVLDLFTVTWVIQHLCGPSCSYILWNEAPELILTYLADVCDESHNSRGDLTDPGLHRTDVTGFIKMLKKHSAVCSHQWSRVKCHHVVITAPVSPWLMFEVLISLKKTSWFCQCWWNSLITPFTWNSARIAQHHL